MTYIIGLLLFGICIYIFYFEVLLGQNFIQKRILNFIGIKEEDKQNLIDRKIEQIIEEAKKKIDKQDWGLLYMIEYYTKKKDIAKLVKIVEKIKENNKNKEILNIIIKVVGKKFNDADLTLIGMKILS